MQAGPASFPWRVLDTEFGDGSGFFESWQSWSRNPMRTRSLHYVAITETAPEAHALLRIMERFPALAPQRIALERQWFGLMSGFHRIVLDGSQVLLTLCLGPLQAMLREQQFMADVLVIGHARAAADATDGAVIAHAAAHAGSADTIAIRYAPADVGTSAWDRWCIKALTRLCRRGTALELHMHSSELKASLARVGFEFDTNVPADAATQAPSKPAGPERAQFRPTWQEGATRHAWRLPAQPASRCVVVGAGLCGALAAAALARRGWQVKVLEAAPEPAAGASGLPVGLLAPIASRDDNIRSRLSRAGVRATLEICHALLQAGQDWSATGVLEQRPDAGSSALLGSWRQGNGAWSEAARAWPSAEPDGVAGAQHIGPTDDSGATWHSRAGWIKPARLVHACLRQSGVTFEGGRKVHALRRNGDEWRLLDVHGSVLAQAPQVVLACTADCVNLLDSALPDSELLQSSLRTSDFPGEVTSHPTRLDTMVAVAGQVSWDWQRTQEARTFPPFPVNGSGSFVPHVPIDDGARAWFAGATYSTMPLAEGNVASAHLENLQRLSTLLPEVAKALRVHFADGDVKAWVGTRYTTADRLPVVGAPDCAMLRGLWVSTGMGSRGLTFAALAAELLAARLGGEPLPMEARLARSLAIERGS